MMRTPRFGVVALLLAGALTIGACSNDDDAAESGAAAGEPTTEETSSMMGGEPFGEACSAVPTEGEGSVEGMSDDPVATAASNNPLLTTLVAAVEEAGLVDTLNGAEELTVFAPTDDAFAAVDKKTLKAAMDDPQGLLTDVLTYHVVEGRIAPEDLAGTHTTLNGADLEVTGMDDEYTVNGSANVICGNVQTANATVYVVDGVLLPAA
jgi:uncharacterized surface protein with fasciclin (FAS1) repeats